MKLSPQDIESLKDGNTSAWDNFTFEDNNMMTGGHGETEMDQS